MQVIKGTYEAEVKIFGSVAVQNKAKMLIDDAVMRSGQNYIRGGTEKGKKCGFGKRKKKTVDCLSIRSVVCWSVFILVFC